MDRCPICNARMMSTEHGRRCINDRCEGASITVKEGVMCKCGAPMHYRGLNTYGEPNYVCTACSATVKL